MSDRPYFVVFDGPGHRLSVMAEDEEGHLAQFATEREAANAARSTFLYAQGVDFIVFEFA